MYFSGVIGLWLSFARKSIRYFVLTLQGEVFVRSTKKFFRSQLLFMFTFTVVIIIYLYTIKYLLYFLSTFRDILRWHEVQNTDALALSHTAICDLNIKVSNCYIHFRLYCFQPYMNYYDITDIICDFQCTRQPDSTKCGNYVIKYMFDIIYRDDL